MITGPLFGNVGHIEFVATLFLVTLAALFADSAFQVIEVDGVFLPMVLQIRETMGLQRAERDGKVGAAHFWIFGPFALPERKHGFAEKLHLE
jgi:hypothetical protein